MTEPTEKDTVAARGLVAILGSELRVIWSKTGTGKERAQRIIARALAAAREEGRREALADAENRLLSEHGLMCEMHPGVSWPHDDCPGPGRTWRLEGEELKALLEKLREGLEEMRDRPENDATDAAHPAWWRGNDHATEVAAGILLRAARGGDDGRGVFGSKLLTEARDAILKLREGLKVALPWISIQTEVYDEEDVERDLEVVRKALG